ncbi:MAG: phospholipase/Carboxylesterase [Belnapia sp.]|nr:phospholipase/Carboxylesterase [Belnapia sp.]
MDDQSNAGRLAARPRPFAPMAWPLPPGLHPLGLHPLGLHPLGMGGARDGLLRVPAAPLDGPLPLIVMLHGAGGDAERMLRRILPIADAALLLLPESLGATWDVLEGGYGPDVARIDAALARILAAWPVDPARLAIAGFSDGASYALSLAMMNGGLFSHALAFSPGFAVPVSIEGQPRLFLSHGTEDAILPIARCSRRLVPKLRQAGYAVEYLEFPGQHELPEAVARAGLAWLNGP